MSNMDQPISSTKKVTNHTIPGIQIMTPTLISMIHRTATRMAEDNHILGRAKTTRTRKVANTLATAHIQMRRMATTGRGLTIIYPDPPKMNQQLSEILP